MGQPESARDWRTRAVHSGRQRLHHRSAGDLRPPRADRNRNRRRQGRVHHRARARISRIATFSRSSSPRRSRACWPCDAAAPRSSNIRVVRMDARTLVNLMLADASVDRLPYLLSRPVAEGAPHQASPVHAAARSEPVPHGRARRDRICRDRRARLRRRDFPDDARGGIHPRRRGRARRRAAPGLRASTSRRASRCFQPRSASRVNPKVTESARLARLAPNPADSADRRRIAMPDGLV